MNISTKGLNFIMNEEGLRLKPYSDSVGVATIGIGSTEYENGTRVTMKDPAITKERASLLFRNTLKKYVAAINKIAVKPLTQNQFDSLVSICYNIGTNGFAGSTLAKLVTHNPADPAIIEAFEKWCKAGGKPILLPRRKREATLYFT
jgi:lysozyme